MKILKALALGTVPVVGAFLCVLLLQLSGAVGKASADAHAVSGEAVATLRKSEAQIPVMASSVTSVANTANVVLNSANRTIGKINAPCEPAPCGTLADLNRTLATARGTMGQVEIAANHEDRNLGLLDAQEETLFADTHKTLADADALVASPYITASLHNLDTTSASVADSAKQADAILTDARQEADKLAHPAKKKLGFWGSLMVGGDFARHFMPSIF